MTNAEAVQLVARLVAAYAHPVVSEETIALYVERVARLDFAACRAAVNDLIDADLAHLPRIGRIKAATAAHVVRRRQQREQRRLLVAPDLSPTEREAMRARVAELVAQVSQRTVVMTPETVARLARLHRARDQQRRLVRAARLACNRPVEPEKGATSA